MRKCVVAHVIGYKRPFIAIADSNDGYSGRGVSEVAKSAERLVQVG